MATFFGRLVGMTTVDRLRYYQMYARTHWYDNEPYSIDVGGLFCFQITLLVRYGSTAAFDVVPSGKRVQLDQSRGHFRPPRCFIEIIFLNGMCRGGADHDTML
jgi:hypothetical protein